MYAAKSFWIELEFKTVERAAEEMIIFRSMQRHVVSLSFNPVDLFRLQKEHAPAGFNDHPIQIFGSRFALGYERQEPQIEVFVSFTTDLSARARERGLKSIFIE